MDQNDYLMIVLALKIEIQARLTHFWIENG